MIGLDAVVAARDEARHLHTRWQELLHDRTSSALETILAYSDWRDALLIAECLEIRRVLEEDKKEAVK